MDLQPGLSGGLHTQQARQSEDISVHEPSTSTSVMQAGQQDGRRLGRSSMRDQQQDVRSSADSRQSNASLRRGSEQDPFTDRSRQQRCSLAMNTL